MPAAAAPEAAEPGEQAGGRSPKRQRLAAAPVGEELMAAKERELAFTRNVMTTLSDIAADQSLSDIEKRGLRASLMSMFLRE